MNKNNKSLDDLETGIKQLLLENRCSFSDEEKALLNDCLATIRQAKKSQSADHVIKILEILSKLFSAINYLTDIF